MKLKSSLVLYPFVALMVSTAPATVSLDKVLEVVPAEPDMLLIVPDLEALGERWLASPVGDAFGEAWLEDLVDALGDEVPEMPDAVEAWIEPIEGGMVFAVAGMGEVFLNQTPPVIVIAAGYTGDPEAWTVTVEEALADGSVVLESFELEGSPALRVIGEGEDAPRVELALIDGVQVFQVGGNGLTDVRDRIDGTVDRFSDGWYPGGAAVEAHLGADLAIFLKGDRVWTGLESLMRREIGRQPNAMIDAESLIDALRLTGLRSMGVSFDFEPEFVRVESDLDYATDSGLGGLFQFREVKGNTLPPVPETALSVARTGFDLSAMLTGVEGLFGRLFPAQFAQYEAQMTNFSNLLGVDIRAALFGGFGTEVLTYSLPGNADGGSGAASDTYVVFELAPGGLLESLYASLARNFAMMMEWIEVEPVGDDSFNVVRLSRFMPVPEGEAGVYAWAFREDALILAVGGEGIHLRYAGVAEPEGTADRDDRAAFLLEQLGVSGAPVALSYSDVEKTLENLSEMMRTVLPASESGPEASVLEFMVESFEDVELEGATISWIEAGVLRSRQDLVRK